MGLPKRQDVREYTGLTRFDARGGVMNRVDRKQDDTGNWSNDLVDITGSFEAVVDMEGLETGWINLTTGVAPDFRMVPLGAKAEPCPGDAFKEGFRLRMKLLNGAGDDVREFSSTSKAVWKSVDELHDAYLAGRDSHPAELPVVMIKEVVQVRTASSTNYRPIFRIARWGRRPAELAVSPTPTRTTAKPSTPKPKPVDPLDDPVPFR
jgi:hypothetical protein